MLQNKGKLDKAETFCWIGSVLSGRNEADFLEALKTPLQNNRIDWAIFLHLADKHLVIPQLYYAFLRLGLLESLPQPIQLELSEVGQLNTERNKQIIKQAEAITTLLNAAGIIPTFLKGCGNLLDGLYKNSGERFIGDIDLWVPAELFLPAAEALIKAGFQARAKFNDFGLDGMKHYPRLHHPDFICDVEIHQFLANPPYHKLFKSNLAGDIKHVTTENTAYNLLKDSVNVLHNFVNSQLSDRAAYRFNPSMRQMYDLLLLNHKTVVEDTFKTIKKNRLKAYAYLDWVMFIFQQNTPSCFNSRSKYKIALYRKLANQEIKSDIFSELVITTDKKLAPIRYYFRNIIRLITEKNYRLKHWNHFLGLNH